MVEELSNVETAMDTTKAEILLKKAEIEDSLKAKKTTVAKYKSNKTLVKQLLKMATEDEKIQKEYVDMLAAKQNELEKKISQLEKAKDKQKRQKRFVGLEQNFKSEQKRLDWPLRGEIIEQFGTKKGKRLQRCCT